MTDYLTLAADLAPKAPAQAKLLRHLLVNPGQTAPEILEQLDYTDANFRVLVGKLRDRGVEVIVKRVTLDPLNPEEVEYRYSIRSDEEIEYWAFGRQGALHTAWERVHKMMVRHLRSIVELDPEARGRIIEKLAIVTDNIDAVEVFTQLKIEEGKAAKAAAEAEEALAERAELRVV